ncbi:unnamed protein product [Nezara viridula]|uniref:Bee-milk protein n=1 Tax=Nezara viridula TaxID=85310 RepID=A0A9P0E6E8_NEZVI|nr:unnamed protein product [Nezara viridula]
MGLKNYLITFVVLLPMSLADYTREMVCAMTMYPNGIELAWECEEHFHMMYCGGMYSPRDMLATRVQMYKEIGFVAFPRFRCGVAATLMAMNMTDYCREEPMMYAFPNWELNNATEPWSMVSVIDLQVDEKSVLWALDSGIMSSLCENPVIYSAPRLVSFCPISGKMLSRNGFTNLVCADSRLQFMEVENTEDGQTFVYISDAGTCALVVWNGEETRGFKVALPRDSTDYPLTKDVLYISLIRRDETGPILYFTYLHGTNMFYIRTCNIRSGRLIGSVVTVGMKPGPMLILGTDKASTMYLRLKSRPELFMWNTFRPFRPKSLILLERADMPFYSTQVMPGYKRLLWTLESNYNDYFNNTHDSIGPRAKLRPLFKFCDTNF